MSWVTQNSSPQFVWKLRCKSSSTPRHLKALCAVLQGWNVLLIKDNIFKIPWPCEWLIFLLGWQSQYYSLCCRRCLFSVQCSCKATFGKSVDALFFATKHDYSRQHNICSKRPMQAFRADVIGAFDANIYLYVSTAPTLCPQWTQFASVSSPWKLFILPFFFFFVEWLCSVLIFCSLPTPHHCAPK